MPFTHIYHHKDPMGDTLDVGVYVSRIGPVAIFRSSSSDDAWLTPKDSKRLRKALKAWERSVA